MLIVQIEADGDVRAALDASGGQIELRVGGAKFALRLESKSQGGISTEYLLTDSRMMAPTPVPAPAPAPKELTPTFDFGEDHED